MERTLIILKPDAVARGIVGEIFTRFEKVGLKMIHPSQDHYDEHYEGIGKLKTRKGDEIHNSTVTSMLAGPVVAAVLEGVEATEVVRKMVGATEPKSALPGTIRADYSHMSYSHSNAVGKSVANVIHASADADEAKAEIAHWFSGEELHSYETVHEKFTQPKA